MQPDLSVDDHGHQLAGPVQNRELCRLDRAQDLGAIFRRRPPTNVGLARRVSRVHLKLGLRVMTENPSPSDDSGSRTKPIAQPASVWE